jgi:hypothetical protein
MHYCVPNQATLPPEVINNWSQISHTLLAGSAGSPIEDMYKARKAIFGSIGVAILFTFVFMIFMDYCAATCSWLALLFVQVGLAGAGVLCWFARNDYIQTAALDPTDKTSKWLLGAAIVFELLAVVYFFVLTCHCRSLQVSIRIIETAADFFADTKRVAFVPIFFIIISIATFCGFVYAYICISSVGDMTVESVALQAKRINHPPYFGYA